MCLPEENDCERHKHHGHGECLAEYAVVVYLLQRSDMSVMLHMVLTVGTHRVMVSCILVSVGDSHRQAQHVQNQQQCGNNPPLSYVFVSLHKSGCKVTKNNPFHKKKSRFLLAPCSITPLSITAFP